MPKKKENPNLAGKSRWLKPVRKPLGQSKIAFKAFTGKVTKSPPFLTPLRILLPAVSLFFLGFSASQAWVNPCFTQADANGQPTGWASTYSTAGGWVSAGCSAPANTTVTNGTAPNTAGQLPRIPPNACCPSAVQLYSSRGDDNHADWASIEQTDTVPTNGDTCLSFWFAGVFESHHYDSGETSNNSDSYLEIDVIVGGSTVATIQYSWETNLAQIVQLSNSVVPANGDGTYCGVNGDPNRWGYLPWTQYEINLCQYAGQQVTFRATDYDCDAGGHYGFGYISCLNWNACPPPKMALTKANSPAGQVSQGSTVTYTITYQNQGTGPADGVVIDDTLPTGTSLVSGSVTSNPPVFFEGQVGNEVVWPVGYVGSGATGTLSFQVVEDQACVTFLNVAHESDFLVACGATQPLSNPVTNWVAGCGSTPTVIATSTFPPTFTPTPSPTLLIIATSTSTGTVSSSPTFPLTPTSTYVSNPSPTPTPDATVGISVTSTYVNPSATPNTATPTSTPTSSSTFTPTPTFTNSPTPTAGIAFVKKVSAPEVVSGQVLTYTLNLTVTTLTFSGVTVSDSLPTGLTYLGPWANNPASLPTPTYQSSTNSLSWTLPPLSPGTYQLSYQTTVNSGLPGGTQLLNKAVLAYSGGAVTSVAPVVVPAAYKVTVGVYNGAGELVAILYQQELPVAIPNITLSSGAITTLSGPGGAVTVMAGGMPLAVWNGLTSSGSPATNGVYHIKVDNVDPAGVDASTTQQVTVNRTLARVEVDVYNEAGEIVRHLYSVVADASASPTVAQLALSSPLLGAGSSVTLEQITLTLSGGPPILLNWDGTNDAGAYLTPGNYLVEAHWTDAAGSQILVQALTLAPSRAAPSVVYVWPNVLSASQGNGIASFGINSTGPNTLLVDIYDTAGERVATVQGPPGSNSAVWNFKGVASGLYIAMVEVEGPQGVISRQTLRLVAVH